MIFTCGEICSVPVPQIIGNIVMLKLIENYNKVWKKSDFTTAKILMSQL